MFVFFFPHIDVILENWNLNSTDRQENLISIEKKGFICFIILIRLNFSFSCNIENSIAMWKFQVGFGNILQVERRVNLNWNENQFSTIQFSVENEKSRTKIRNKPKSILILFQIIGANVSISFLDSNQSTMFQFEVGSEQTEIYFQQSKISPDSWEYTLR